MADPEVSARQRGIYYARETSAKPTLEYADQLLDGPYELDGYYVYFHRGYYEHRHISLNGDGLCYHAKRKLRTRLPRFSDEKMWAVYDAVEETQTQPGKINYSAVKNKLSHLNLSKYQIRTHYERARGFVSIDEEQAHTHEQKPETLIRTEDW